MREAAERRQQLELEHEQALAVLNAKQQEIDLLQKVRKFEHSPEVLGLRVGQACVRVVGQKTFCLALLLKGPTSHQKDCINERRGKNSALSRKSREQFVCYTI